MPSLDLQDDRRVAPQPLELVELALLGDERVHDDISEIDEDPSPAAVPLDADRHAARGLRLLDDAIGDRLHLTFAATAAQDEEVGDGRDLGHVHDEDVFGLLVARRLDDEIGHCARAPSAPDDCPAARYRPRASMCRQTASGTRYRSDRPRAALARSSRALTSRRAASPGTRPAFPTPPG